MTLADQWALVISGGVFLLAYLCLAVIREGLEP